MVKPAYLILENGKIFKGKSFGACYDVISEIVFTTGMTGYLETLTDKSYFGQIVVQTFPLIGNYGVISSDFESNSTGGKIQTGISAYIVKHWCQEPSNFRSEGNLDTFLKSQGIVGLYNIDTRTLTKIIRENGVMNGKITTSIDNINFSEIKSYKIKDAVASVSTHSPYQIKADNSRYKVVLLDFGLKENIKRELLKRGCDVVVMPYNTSAAEIFSQRPSGVMLSNGPGDPADNSLVIQNLKQLLQSNIPIFGICLGHQLLALSCGFKTAKLKYGHRGANQPVRDLFTNRVYISSQNHGYTVVSESIDTKKAKEFFKNVNDQTCEGIEYLNSPVFSVQFHPEACAGPQDTAFLFDKFINMMEVNKNATR